MGNTSSSGGDHAPQRPLARDLGDIEVAVVEWEGRLTSGAAAPAGVYYIAADDGRIVRTRRLVRLD